MVQKFKTFYFTIEVFYKNKLKSTLCLKPFITIKSKLWDAAHTKALNIKMKCKEHNGQAVECYEDLPNFFFLICYDPSHEDGSRCHQTLPFV